MEVLQKEKQKWLNLFQLALLVLPPNLFLFALFVLEDDFGVIQLAVLAKSSTTICGLILLVELSTLQLETQIMVAPIASFTMMRGFLLTLPREVVQTLTTLDLGYTLNDK